MNGMRPLSIVQFSLVSFDEVKFSFYFNIVSR